MFVPQVNLYFGHIQLIDICICRHIYIFFKITLIHIQSNQFKLLYSNSMASPREERASCYIQKIIRSRVISFLLWGFFADVECLNWVDLFNPSKCCLSWACGDNLCIIQEFGPSAGPWGPLSRLKDFCLSPSNLGSSFTIFEGSENVYNVLEYMNLYFYMESI